MGGLWSIDTQVKLALCQLATSTDKETNIATARKAIQVQPCSLVHGHESLHACAILRLHERHRADTERDRPPSSRYIMTA